MKPEWDKPFQTYYPNVIEFDDAFADLIDHPGILEGVFQVVGQDAQIYSNEILVSKPNESTMAWHRDKMSIGRHCPNLFLKLAIFLDHVAVLTYIPWWMKQPPYYTGLKCEKLLKSASPLRRQLLGAQLRPGVSLDSFST